MAIHRLLQNAVFRPDQIASMAETYENALHKANDFRSPRAELHEFCKFCKFYGFD